MPTANPTKAAKPDRLAALISEALVQASTSGTSLTFGSVVASLGDESDPDKVAKAFSKVPLKGAWIVVVPKWEGSPIVRNDHFVELARDGAFLVKMAERACSAEQPEVPLAQIVKPVEKTLAKEMAAFWTEHLEQLPGELRAIVAGTAKKKTVRIHLKRYPSPAEVLSKCLLTSLQTLRQRDPDHYPASINEILSDDLPFTGFHEDAVDAEPFVSHVVRIFKPGKKSPSQLYGLIEDMEMLSGSPRLLESIWPKSQKAGDDGVSLKELLKQATSLIDSKIAEPFKEQINQAVKHRRLPRGIASLRMGKDVILFETKGIPSAKTGGMVHSSTGTSMERASSQSSGFAQDFEREFDRLFDQGGRLKSVKLSDLRSRLPNYSRDEFNRGLNDLRRQQKFTLEPNEGQRVHLSKEEQDAGIVEAGQSLFFCRRM